MTTLADLRRDYASRALTEDAADADPLRQFGAWFDEALKSQLIDVNAMTLATASPAGEPAARIVLLKGVDEAGSCSTPTTRAPRAATSRPTRARACCSSGPSSNGRCASPGPSPGRRARNRRAYFHSRPFESQIGAGHLEAESTGRRPCAARDSVTRNSPPRHRGSIVPLPPNWGGYRVTPERIEFWQGRTEPPARSAALRAPGRRLACRWRVALMRDSADLAIRPDSSRQLRH